MAWVRHRRPLPSLLSSFLRCSVSLTRYGAHCTSPIPSPLTFRSRRPSLHFQRAGPRLGPSQVTGEKVRCETLVPGGQTEDSLHPTVGMYVVAYWLLLRMEREREMFEGRCVDGWFSFGLVSCVICRGVCPIRKRVVICKIRGVWRGG